MSTYIKSPFKPAPQLAVAGTPSYLFGSYNDKTGPTLGYVISNSGVTTTGSITFQIVSGNIPLVGALISAVGQANSNNFNVTNATILTVTTTNEGVCTVTFTISSTTQVNTADAGQVVIQQPEVGDTIVNNTATASVPVAIPFNNPEMQEGKSITATLTLPNTGNLSAIVAVLQGADIDLDSEYKTIHTFASVTAANTFEIWQSGSDTQFITATAAPGTIGSNPGGVNVINYRFLRFNLTAVTGTGPAIGKIEI